MSADGAISIGHPVVFGVLFVLALIEGCITAYLVARYNKHGYPGGHFRSTIRFGLFTSWWTVVFTGAYIGIFLAGVQNVVSSIASHAVWLFITWVFWLAYAASTANMLIGVGSCGGSWLEHCAQNQAAQAFAWMEWIVMTFALAFIIFLGWRSMRRGDRISGPLTA